MEQGESMSEELAIDRLPAKDALRLCRDTEDITTIISLTKHADPIVRQRALKEICPCRVKDDIDLFWARVIEMIGDPADNVREQVSVKCLSSAGDDRDLVCFAGVTYIMRRVT